MKIAFVYPHLYYDDPPASLGDSIAILTYEMATRLARTCDVTVYPRRGFGQPAREHRDGVCYRRIFATDDQLLTLCEIPDRLGLRNPQRPFCSTRWYYRGYVSRVARSLAREGSQIVHVFTFPQFARTIRAHNPHAKIFLHMEDHSLADRDGRVLAGQLADVDGIIGCSDFVTDRIRERFPALAANCRTIFNGVDLAAFDAAAANRPSANCRPKRILYVGRISPEKGLHVLLDAFRQVVTDHPDVHLDIVGPEAVAPRQFVDPLGVDPQFDGLRSFYRQRRGYLAHLKRAVPATLADRVSFVGRVPYRRIESYYRQADVLVIPSLWHEPFGMPATEAMAAGVPLIATRGGAFTEIVSDGETGLLVERGDARGLALALLRLLADDERRAMMGAAGRERAREFFGWNRVVDELLAFYRQIAA